LSPENPSFMGLDAWLAGFYPHGLIRGIDKALKIIVSAQQTATRASFTRNTLDLGEPRNVLGDVDALRQRGIDALAQVMETPPTRRGSPRQLFE
jgi:hypothetical protein